ncbi:MAG: hypothetical protein BZY81_03155 [SAR202 cluster bacterium Io17-Chloro-G4]|nr:MAG: hypothetical protein BZY81_03155 [SAR202 cluster bacterium Io17-Chloro-G4]
MAILQIAADRPGSGKSSLAGALLLHLTSAGKRTAYYKPLSPLGGDDPDVSFFSQSLLADSSLPPAPPSNTLPREGDSLEGALSSQIETQASQLKSQSDAVLLEGPDLANADGSVSSLALDLANATDSKVLAVIWYSKGLAAEFVARACQPLGERLAGVLINGVTPYRSQQAKAVLGAELAAKGIPLLGVVPEDRTMLGVSVQQIADYLNGRWVQEPENVDARVERFLIGGNIMDSGPSYFGRYSNQAVITRGARPDIQMASLTCDPCCLVLTGGDEPAEYVKSEASQKGVPLILVDTNTIDTADSLGGLLDLATSRSLQKIQRFQHLLEEHADMDALASLALS